MTPGVAWYSRPVRILNLSRAPTWAATAGFVLLLSLALIRVEAASASTFTVSRVQVFLSAKAKSEVLTVRNVSTETLRFQLSVFAWDQTPQGEMVLAPTRDIVFFPPLFALAPGEERNIRVGAATPPAASEKTYRLFVEELPRPEGGSPGGPPGQVTIRTRLGIPIFLRPPNEVAGGRLEAVALRDGRVSFDVRNTGNVHFVPQAVRITGYGPGGETVTQGMLEGWYILAGGTRTYELDLPADKCPGVIAVSIEVRTAQAAFTERLDVTPTACRR
jgi:fimbrial chaperone protein